MIRGPAYVHGFQIEVKHVEAVDFHHADGNFEGPKGELLDCEDREITMPRGSSTHPMNCTMLGCAFAQTNPMIATSNLP